MKKGIIITVIFVILAVVLFFIMSGNFVVAIVNWQPIWYKDFQNVVLANQNFYNETKNATSTRPVDWSDISNKKTLSNFQKTALQNLIEDKILISYLNRFGVKNLDSLVTQKISEGLKGQTDVSPAARDLAGWDMAKFSKYVLEPVAREEIFQSEVIKIGTDKVAKLINDYKNKNSIFILFPGFKWDDQNFKVIEK